MYMYVAQVKRASLVDSRTAVNDVKFAPRHLGLQLVSDPIHVYMYMYMNEFFGLFNSMMVVHVYMYNHVYMLIVIIMYCMLLGTWCGIFSLLSNAVCEYTTYCNTYMYLSQVCYEM